MRFLLDAQLPRRLARELQAMGHEAIHTLDLPAGNRTKDGEINAVADQDGRIVVSKDSDFRDSHLLQSTPRQLLRVTTGNISNADLLGLFGRHLDAIEEAFQNSDHVELTGTELIVHSRREA